MSTKELRIISSFPSAASPQFFTSALSWFNRTGFYVSGYTRRNSVPALWSNIRYKEASFCSSSSVPVTPKQNCSPAAGTKIRRSSHQPLHRAIMTTFEYNLSLLGFRCWILALVELGRNPPAAPTLQQLQTIVEGPA